MHVVELKSCGYYLQIVIDRRRVDSAVGQAKARKQEFFLRKEEKWQKALRKSVTAHLNRKF